MTRPSSNGPAGKSKSFLATFATLKLRRPKIGAWPKPCYRASLEPLRLHAACFASDFSNASYRSLPFETEPIRLWLAPYSRIFRVIHFDLQPEVIDTICIAERLIKFNLPSGVQIVQRHIKRLAAFLRTLHH